MELQISTHTPLAGRDDEYVKNAENLANSTHTPLAGRDDFFEGGDCYLIFLLTRPLRDVTCQYP